jgi:glycosyltransferase involved in cell wall biosynthesis
MGAPAGRVSELCQRWAEAGHEVTVLTGFPNHPDGILHPAYRRQFHRLVFQEKWRSVNVVRSWLLPFPNRRPYERMLNYSSFCASAALTGSFIDRPDVVIATSPQLLVGVAGWWIAKVKRVPLVLEVRDLWPESLSAVGVGTSSSALHRGLCRIAGFLYEHSEHIVVVTPATREYLIKKREIAGEKISVIPNGVETGLFRPGTLDFELRQQWNPDGKFVVSFIGTLGLAHGLDTVIAAADRLQSVRPDVLFLLVGEGADRGRIARLAESKQLTNLRIVPQQPRERIPAFIALSDVCLVLLKNSRIFETVIPTKMLEFMSCARPVILGVAGQARQIAEQARAGICIQPENVDALCCAILKLQGNPVLRDRLSRNGREYIIRNFSRERTAGEYLDLLHSIVAGRSSLHRAAAA